MEQLNNCHRAVGLRGDNMFSFVTNVIACTALVYFRHGCVKSGEKFAARVFTVGIVIQLVMLALRAFGRW